jgi:hypothetical protein
VPISTLSTRTRDPRQHASLPTPHASRSAAHGISAIAASPPFATHRSAPRPRPRRTCRLRALRASTRRDLRPAPRPHEAKAYTRHMFLRVCTTNRHASQTSPSTPHHAPPRDTAHTPTRRSTSATSPSHQRASPRALSHPLLSPYSATGPKVLEHRPASLTLTHPAPHSLPLLAASAISPSPPRRASPTTPHRPPPTPPQRPQPPHTPNRPPPATTPTPTYLRRETCTTLPQVPGDSLQRNTILARVARDARAVPESRTRLRMRATAGQRARTRRWREGRRRLRVFVPEEFGCGAIAPCLNCHGGTERPVTTSIPLVPAHALSRVACTELSQIHTPAQPHALLIRASAAGALLRCHQDVPSSPDSR